MIRENEYPILEFDNDITAKLNPTSFGESSLSTNKLVITFFPEVIDKLAADEEIVIDASGVVKVFDMTL